MVFFLFFLLLLKTCCCQTSFQQIHIHVYYIYILTIQVSDMQVLYLYTIHIQYSALQLFYIVMQLLNRPYFFYALLVIVSPSGCGSQRRCCPFTYGNLQVLFWGLDIFYFLGLFVCLNLLLGRTSHRGGRSAFLSLPPLLSSYHKHIPIWAAMSVCIFLFLLLCFLSDRMENQITT